MFVGYDKVKASEKFHQDVLDVELEPNVEENDSRLVRLKKLVVEKQQEKRNAQKTNVNSCNRNNSVNLGYGLRTTLSDKERKIVHSAFYNLNVHNDLTSSGLLKFQSITAFAKKNEELQMVIDDLLLRKHCMSKVKCIIQSSMRNRTKKLSRAAKIKTITRQKQHEEEASKQPEEEPSTQ